MFNLNADKLVKWSMEHTSVESMDMVGELVGQLSKEQTHALAEAMGVLTFGGYIQGLKKGAILGGVSVLAGVVIAELWDLHKEFKKIEEAE